MMIMIFMISSMNLYDIYHISSIRSRPRIASSLSESQQRRTSQGPWPKSPHGTTAKSRSILRAGRGGGRTCPCGVPRFGKCFCDFFWRGTVGDTRCEPKKNGKMYENVLHLSIASVIYQKYIRWMLIMSRNSSPMPMKGSFWVTTPQPYPKSLDVLAYQQMNNGLFYML